MDIPIHTRLGQDQCTYNIALDCLDLVVFAPVDVWSAGLASTVYHMGRFDFVENFTSRRLILHANTGSVDVFVLSTEEFEEMACDPAMLAPDEVLVCFVRLCHDV
jgi:hypothetical protein